MSASLFARVARSPAVRTSALATKLRSRQLHIEAKLDRIGIELPTPMRFVTRLIPLLRVLSAESSDHTRGGRSLSFSPRRVLSPMTYFLSATLCNSIHPLLYRSNANILMQIQGRRLKVHSCSPHGQLDLPLWTSSLQGTIHAPLAQTQCILHWGRSFSCIR